MSSKSLKLAFQQLGLISELESIERGSVRRLFQGETDLETFPRLEAMLAFASMDTYTADIDHETKLMLDNLAHAICDAFDIVSRPDPEKLQLAQRAAMFFNVGDYSAKSATIANMYRLKRHFLPFVFSGKDVDGAMVCVRIASTAMWALNASDVKIFGELAGRAKKEIGRTLFGEEGRFSLYLSSILSGLEEILTAEEFNTTSDQICARLELLASSSSKIADIRLLSITRSITVATNSLLRNATNLIFRSGGLRLSSRMRAALVGSVSEKPVYQLWPAQKAALKNGAIKMPFHVVSAPTSGGKTLIAELKIASYLEHDPNGLAIYVAPYNALAAQVGRDLTKRFRAANIPSAEVWTGSYSIITENVNTSNILVTTPEKLDAIVRNFSSDELCHDVVQRVGLFIFDECHLVGTNSRGITYEFLITRLRERFPNAGFLAMSAVASNATKLATWIANNPTASTVDDWTPTRRRLLVFRPNGQLLDTHGNEVYRLPKWGTAKEGAVDLALRFGSSKASPVLIMCTQRRYAINVAKDLYNRLEQDVEIPKELEIARIKLSDILGAKSLLVSLISLGVAYHHAGLPTAARDIIEQLASNGNIKFLASTTTAHLINTA